MFEKLIDLAFQGDLSLLDTLGESDLLCLLGEVHEAKSAVYRQLRGQLRPDESVLDAKTLFRQLTASNNILYYIRNLSPSLDELA